MLSDQIRTLLETAVLAPSSHNTQPWLFAVSARQISLLADRTRALPVNDPDDRELTISCGAALFNLRVAAAHVAIGARVHSLPERDNDDLLAVVNLDESATPGDEGALFMAMKTRRTYRKRFKPVPVEQSVLAELAENAEREGAWLMVLAEPRLRQDAAELVAEGDAMQWANPAWRRELAAWMHARGRGYGLTLPRALLPVARTVVRTFDMGSRVGAQDRQLAEQAPVLAVLGTSGDGPSDWLTAGQALQRVLLIARKRGLQASFLNQPIQVASLRPKLRDAIQATGCPQILLRLGYPSQELRAATRRPLVDVLVEGPD